MNHTVTLVLKNRSVVDLQLSSDELKETLNSEPCQDAVALVVVTVKYVQYFTPGADVWTPAVEVPLSVAVKCICKMPPGNNAPNREQYMLDHRCLRHGEKAQPALWGRHKDLEMFVDISVYNALVVDTTWA